MKKNRRVIIGILVSITLIAIGFAVLPNGLGLMMGNPTGGRGPNYPYFITTEPIIVKKILLPKGTKLTYEEQSYKEGQQEKIMTETKLTQIELPEGKTIDWGGVPVNMILKYFNSEMRGFSVYPDFDQLSDGKKTKFSELWQSCSSDLGVDVRDIDDWSFNIANITDIESCSVNYQRYFKQNTEQQQFLDNLYKELKNIN